MQIKATVVTLTLFILIYTLICMTGCYTPPRVFTSSLWSPQKQQLYEDNIVIIDMASEASWPSLSRNLGSFIEENVIANIIIIPFRDITQSKINEYKPKAVIVSGFFQPISSYKNQEMEGLFNFFKTTDVPVLAICGGFEFMGKAFGSEIIPLEKKEIGFIEVRIISDDPVFHGLSSPIVVYSWHRKEISPLPEGFILLGTNSTCNIQIIRHKIKRIYGVQFHPEFSTQKYVDGVNLIRNFFKIANVTLRKK